MDTERDRFVGFLNEMQAGADLAPPGMAVYANTGLRASLLALEANYPAVQAALGPAAMSAVCRRFVQACPPVDGRLFLYGEGFAEDLPMLLASLPEAVDAEALQDLAALDRLWTQCHTAADAQVLSAARLAGLAGSAPQQLWDCTPTLAPATHWRLLPSGSVLQTWAAARHAPLLAEPQGSGPCVALFTRPDDEVLVHALPPEGAQVLTALADGASLGQAVSAASEPGSPHDLSALLGHLLGHLLNSGALVLADLDPSPDRIKKDTP